MQIAPRMKKIIDRMFVRHMPYFGNFFAGSRMLVLKVPRHLLEARLGQTRQMTARAIKPSDDDHRLTTSLLAMLPVYAGKLGPVAETLIANQALDLAAMSLSKVMEGQSRVSSARSLILIRIRAAIEARLADPALDASTVASCAGVSIRYANSVLAEEKTSISRLIGSRRLERCRSALADPAQARRKVSEIAHGWGFSDMTHFGRRFKATYGVLPSEYRALRKRV